MKRRPIYFATCFIVWLVLSRMFATVHAEGNAGVAWNLWILTGYCSLTATAVELSLLLVWVWRKTVDRRDVEVVPRTLDARLHAEFRRSGLRVAALVPAHNEAATRSDADGLVARILHFALVTPGYVDIFFLFDSAINQQQNEYWVVSEIKRRLQALGRHGDVDRIKCCELRNKRPSRRNKPGSIYEWGRVFGDFYKYAYIKDGDSSLLTPDPRRPETCHVLERILLGMEANPDVAMVQAAIEITESPTLWSEYQQVNSKLSQVHGRLYQYILEDQAVSYGHNLIWKTQCLLECCTNMLGYLSHDHCDSADAAAAGHRCVSSYSVVTGETTEASLYGHAVVRDARWQKGNAMFWRYQLIKPGITCGARYYLTMAILSYVWPTLASLFAISSVTLIAAGQPLIAEGNATTRYLLIAAVVVALYWSKLVGAQSHRQLVLALVVGLVMAPSLMVVQGALWIISPLFGSKWKARNSRSNEVDLDHLRKLLSMSLPVSALGALLLHLLNSQPDASLGMALLRGHIGLLIVSPLLAIAVSLPVYRGGSVRSSIDSSVVRNSL